MVVLFVGGSVINGGTLSSFNIRAFEILNSNSNMTYVSLSLNYPCLIIIYEGFLVITTLLGKMCEKIVFN